MSQSPVISKTILYASELIVRVVLAYLSYSLLPLVFYSDVQHYFEVGQAVGVHHLPYRDFVWEFPPLTTLSLLLIVVTGRDSALFHVSFVGLMILCEWGSLQLLRRFDAKNFWAITAFWTVSVVPMSLLAWSRLDFLSVIITTAGLVMLLRGRPIVTWVVLGFLAKLWPVLLCAGLFTQRRFKELAVVVAAVGVATGAWFVFSPEGFRTFLRFRRGEGFQLESIPGALLHYFGRDWFFSSGAVSISDKGWEWLQPTMFVLTAVGIAVLLMGGLLRRRRDDVLLIGACVAITLVFSRLISPQFLVWLAPFIALRVKTHLRIAGLYFLSIVLTFILLCFYQQLTDQTGSLLNAMLVFRNFLLMAMTIDMAWSALTPKRNVRVALADEQSGA